MEEFEGICSSVLRKRRPGHLKFRYVFGRMNSSKDLKVRPSSRGRKKMERREEIECDDVTLHI